MRTATTIASILLGSLLSLSFVSAAHAEQLKPAKKNVAAAQKKKKTSDESAAALPPPPPPPVLTQPEPVAAPPAPILVDVPPPPVVAMTSAKNRDKDEAKPEADDDDPPNAGPGFVGGVRLGGEVLVGEADKSSSLAAGFSSVSGSAGYYFTDHVGLLAGLKFGFGMAFECPMSDCSTASTWQVPVTLQYALNDRTRGAYFEGGLGLLNGVHLNVKGADANLELTTPVEAKFGAGYRWKSRQGKVTQATILYGAVDVGEYSAVSAHVGDREVASRDIASNAKAIHVSFSMGVGFQF